MTDSSSQDGGAPPDGDLARAAASGDRSALDALLRRHQRWIYNLALRMLWNAHDAEDATQEILLKIATRLGSYRGESTLRTWAWRIAANHILSRRRGRTEEVIHGFECYGAALAATAETEWNEVGPEDRLLVQEAAIGCTVGLLLCLDREQRLAFVLGEIFGATDAEGADVMGTRRDAFRQRLSRARRQLYAFLQDRCGLADPRNPCRCERKTRGFVKAGIVDPRRLVFAAEHVARVEQIAPERADALGRAARAGFARLYRSQPFQEGPDLAARLLKLLDDPTARSSLAGRG